MVECMVRRAIDYTLPACVANHIRIVDLLAMTNHNAPQVNQAKHREEQKLLHRKDHWENVVRQTLRIAVEWVESM